MTVMIGWWIVPMMVTVTCLMIVIFWRGIQTTHTDTISRGATALVNLLIIAVLIIISLTAWLIWAVLR